ncbi:hypothetical protein [Streptomyces sp. NPDC017993]|uniref:hypothetical protein n=1 Tax=Streptomyces sp. NPDC017993 TaxID=3365027 RepID=UPI0037BB3C7E
MGQQFKVDTDQLTQFGNSLTHAHTALNEAREALAHVRTGQIGTKELDEACDNFNMRWHHGAKELGERVKEISKGVLANRDNYLEIEKALDAAFKKQGGTH